MYHIYIISDGTGKTAEGVVRAALTQFEDAPVEIVRHGGIRNVEQVNEIVDEARETGGFIVHTLVSEKMRTLILTAGRGAHVPTIDLMGPMLARLSELLATKPRSVPGLFSTFDPGYIQRIEAIDFTVRHDDGQNIDDLERAEIVLLGVSRTSKTPLSIYLGYRGWRVANVPLVLGMDPPRQIFQLPRKRAVGLIIRPERLAELRHARVDHMGVGSIGYADLDFIKQEMAFAYEIFEQRQDWPLVDVTTKPIEETAAEVVALLGRTWKGFGDINAE